jgi:hypothetical protein
MARHRGRGRHGGAPRTSQAAEGAASSTAAPETTAEGAAQAAPKPRERQPRARQQAMPPQEQARQGEAVEQPREGRRRRAEGASPGENARESGGRGAARRQSRPRPTPEPSHDDEAAAAAECAPAAASQDGEQRKSCTLAQMRRFIKSRPYVPVHELRRRFEIEGVEDEVSPIATGKGTVFIGLPAREAGFLGELIKSGEVGYEQLLDPVSPGVIGVFPMRPIARQ